ncbi:hypothetical protein FOPG_19322 [Fusarium oxysporum f. sp. conglutinans race 2 54008]|uniref:Uncharacterized protein n=1 Tax=Fusarium oxysporum f. sp. conglutinans race 2 54008 TaxID=1089457 RepID=X0GMA8_FUSOX|nr:hypothetical protein FOPG_19322 [Fusarium oxysporum f. sp. conglutinans race 2 54008]KAG6996109.1 hypothetical protein FocnCong_v016338 [Fusarium oxysporum f. sp. conglutinans]KAK2684427.1 hypothetical protein QWA68_016746 [Fusarium oxysporum]
MEHPTPSQTTSVPPEAHALLAQFEEWPLQGTSLKRITEGNITTFQLQFEWTPHPEQQCAAGRRRSQRRRSHTASLPETRSSGGKWTAEEDAGLS